MAHQHDHPPEREAAPPERGTGVTQTAVRQLRRVAAVLAPLGIQFFGPGRDVVGAGVRVGRDPGSFVVLSVSGPAGDVLNLTAGVLKNVSHERLALLELCNSLTRDNAAFPVYLHDAPGGWDVHLQQRYFIDLLEEAPRFFRTCVESLPATADTARTRFREAGVAGDRYSWSEADAQRLLIRSLV